MQWENYKWKPERKEKYYFIDESGRVMWSLHNSYAIDRPRIEYGNCFQTEQQAKEVAEKVKELFKSL